ncbi:MAG: hypothetical protein JWM20_508 [Patescibacteria group bacterium]|nr:hypothetical protein [Patescibacteria group bacterium]
MNQIQGIIVTEENIEEVLTLIHAKFVRKESILWRRIYTPDIETAREYLAAHKGHDSMSIDHIPVMSFRNEYRLGHSYIKIETVEERKCIRLNDSVQDDYIMLGTRVAIEEDGIFIFLTKGQDPNFASSDMSHIKVWKWN